MYKKRARLAGFALLLAAYLVSIGVFAHLGRHYPNADAASELVYADLMNREGGLLSHGWIYSTELRVLCPTPIYRLGLALFPTWHAARTFSLAILLAITAACFLYMLAPLGLASGPLLAAMLMLPFSGTMAEIFTYGGHYAPYLSVIFLLLGLLLRAGERGFRWRYAVPAALLALWGGLNGMRLIMMLAAPLALALLAECIGSQEGAKTLREGIARLPGGLIALALVVLGGLALGYGVNSRVMAAKYTFDSYAATPIVIPEADIAFIQLTEAAAFFGFRETTRLLSARGVVSLAAIGLLALCLAAPVRLLKEKERKAPARRLMALYAFFAVLLGMVVNAITENYVAHYYLPGLIAAMVCLLLRIEGRRWPGAVRGLAALAVFSVFALSAGIYIREDMPREATAQERAAAYLIENGYTRGYATFWNGAPLTEASDGAIEVWVLDEPTYTDDWKALKLNAYLQEKRHFAEDPQGRVFVYLDGAEAADPPIWADAAHRLLQADFGSIYGYESAEELKELAGK